MKTTTATLSSQNHLSCFECDSGQLQSVREDYTARLPSLGEVTVPSVPMLRCDSCGDTVIGDEGNKRIDAWLDKETRSITPEEIQAFLAKYRLTQKEASSITGLGEKNIGRWLSGKARPSESVSNFLRLLAANESAFELLKHRNFGT